MKKIVSLFIIFSFLFNLVPYAFAVENGSVDIGGFDEFSIEQVQKTFSNTLSCQTVSDSESQHEADNFLFCNTTDFNIPNSVSVNLKNTQTSFFNYDCYTYGQNYLCEYFLTDKQNCIDGIGEYKIKQNTYMAVALFDTVSSIHI